LGGVSLRALSKGAAIECSHRPESVTHWKIRAYQFVVDKVVNQCYRRLCYFKQAWLLPSPTPALSLAPSIACGLFFILSLEGPIAKKVNSFGIKQIQPLFPKCRGGVGIPIPSLDSRRESTETPGAGDESTGHPGVWGPKFRFCSPLVTRHSLQSGVWGPRFARHSPLAIRHSLPRCGVPSWGDLCAKSCPRLTEGFLKLSTVNCRLLTAFEINTCKSVSKQTTLTPFTINTYAKRGEGGREEPGKQRTRSCRTQELA
jgi:hypothetical protein